MILHHYHMILSLQTMTRVQPPLLTTLNACSHMIKYPYHADAIQLQSDLDRLTHWSSFWRLLFNELLMQFCRNLVVDSTYRIAGK